MSGTWVVHTPAGPMRADWIADASARVVADPARPIVRDAMEYLAYVERRRVAREWQRHAGLVPDVELLPTFADWRRARALALVGAATDPGRAR